MRWEGEREREGEILRISPDLSDGFEGGGESVNGRERESERDIGMEMDISCQCVLPSNCCVSSVCLLYCLDSSHVSTDWVCVCVCVDRQSHLLTERSPTT